MSGAGQVDRFFFYFLFFLFFSIFVFACDESLFLLLHLSVSCCSHQTLCPGSHHHQPTFPCPFPDAQHEPHPQFFFPLILQSTPSVASLTHYFLPLNVQSEPSKVAVFLPLCLSGSLSRSLARSALMKGHYLNPSLRDVSALF